MPLFLLQLLAHVRHSQKKRELVLCAPLLKHSAVYYESYFFFLLLVTQKERLFLCLSVKWSLYRQLYVCFKKLLKLWLGGVFVVVSMETSDWFHSLGSFNLLNWQSTLNSWWRSDWMSNHIQNKCRVVRPNTRLHKGFLNIFFCKPWLPGCSE